MLKNRSIQSRMLSRLKRIYACASTLSSFSRFNSPREASFSSTTFLQQEQHRQHPKKIALVMGVANHRSIAWACVESFRQKHFDVVFTYQDDNISQHKKQAAMDTLIANSNQKQETGGKILEAIPCNVETDLPRLFQDQIPELLDGRTGLLDSIVHSIAYAPFKANSSGNCDSSISEASLQDFQTAHHISTFSLLETTRYAKSMMNSSLENGGQGASITALTYLGANRAVSNYGLMGPAKASLEACVRGLAVELGSFTLPSTASSTASSSSSSSNSQQQHSIRVNAVSAGPLRTLSSRGIPQFTELYQHVEKKAPLQRNVTHQEVADTVRFLATDGTGMTGQVIYVDAGYSSVVPV